LIQVALTITQVHHSTLLSYNVEKIGDELAHVHESHIRASGHHHRHGHHQGHHRGHHRSHHRGHHHRAHARAGDTCDCIPNGLPIQSGLTIDAPGTEANQGYDFVKKEGTNSTVTYLPSTYGSYCAPWEHTYDHRCKAEFPPAFCAQTWCYVRKACELPDVKKSLFFPGTTLYYSYKQCGSFDAYTAFECHKKSEEECDRPCEWNKAGMWKEVDQVENAVENVNEVESEVENEDEETEGMCQTELCQCTGEGGNIGVDQTKYGEDYGTFCHAWDREHCETWRDSEQLGLWCCKRWCYVSETCPSAKRSSVAQNLYYSYFVCPDDPTGLKHCPWKAKVEFRGEPMPKKPEIQRVLRKHPPAITHSKKRSRTKKRPPMSIYEDRNEQSAVLVAIGVIFAFLAIVIIAVRMW